MKRVLPASFTTTNKTGLSYQDNQKLKKSKDAEIDEALQRYKELSEYSSATPAQFIELVLDIQRRVNEDQATEETTRCAMAQLNHLFPNISNLGRAQELIIILEDLAMPNGSISTTVWRDGLCVTLDLNKLLEELERLDRDRKPIFDLLPKDIEPQLLTCLDSQSLQAMRLVSKVACDRASGKLTSKFIRFFGNYSGDRSHQFNYFKNLDLPSVSIKISGIGRNEMGSRSVTLFSELMEILSKNKKIREIKLDVSSGYFRGCHSEKEVVRMVHATSQVPTITELNISDIGLGFIQAEVISGLPKLTRLIIKTNNLGPDSAEQLAKLTNLSTLDIADNNLGPDGAEHVAKMTNLTTLNISINKLGPNDAERVAKLTNLTTLDISNNNLGPGGAEPLTKLTKLATLSIRRNDLDPEDADHVAKLTNLTSLTFSDQYLDPGCKERLAKLTNLTSLTIG